MLGFNEPEDGSPPEAVWSGPGSLDEVAIEGPCVIVDKASEFWANGRPHQDYRSEILRSPTWRDLLTIAQGIIETTGDWHHIYLETVEEAREHDLLRLSSAFEKDPPRVFTLGLGS